MKMLQDIGFLLGLYRQAGRVYILKQTYKNRAVPKYLTYFSYFLFSFLVLILANYPSWFKPYAIFLMPIVIFTFYCVVELQIATAHKEIYKKYSLKEMTFFKRSSFLHYIYFCEKLDQIEHINFESLEKLSLWNDINKEKISSLNFHSSPLYILVITSLFAVITEYIKFHLLTGNFLIIAIYLIILITFFWWAVTDYKITDDKRALSVSRFVSWYLLEKKESYNQSFNTDSMKLAG